MSRLAARIIRRTRAETGWVVVTAIVLMTIMLGVGLAVLATADTQSSQSRVERVRESAFDVAEGLLQAEAVVLQSNWPSQPPCSPDAPSCGYAWTSLNSDSCSDTLATSHPSQCPTPSQLIGAAGIFSNVDQARTPVTWHVQIRDDLGTCLTATPQGYTYGAFYSPTCQVPTYYKGVCAPPNGPPNTDATKCWPTVNQTFQANPNNAPGEDQTACKNAANASVACTWDANGNKQVWVRVDARVNGKKRSLVALLHLENFPVTLNSKDAVNGGAVNFTNSGNKNVVDATNSQIVARCYPTTGANADAGNSLSTTLASAVTVANNTPTVAVNTAAVNGKPVVLGTTGLRPGMVVALGVDTGVINPYELLTIQSVNTSVSPQTITFTTKVQYQHSAGEKLELAPAPPSTNPLPNNCESWTSPNAPGQNGADKHQLDTYPAYKSNPIYPNFMDDPTFQSVVAGIVPTPANTCPTNWNGNIYIPTAPAAGCTMPGGTYNSSAAPHFIIVGAQTSPCTNPAINLSGNTVYYGVIYIRDMGCGYTQPVVQVQAGAQVQGGIAVDGHGLVNIGQASNSGNCTVQGGTPSSPTCPTVKFDPVAFGSIAASGAAGLVQNTWRELAPGQ